jgi:hypothetical protein
LHRRVFLISSHRRWSGEADVHRDEDRTWDAFARAIDVAIANGALEPKARSWGRVVLLETFAGILGVAATRLKNQYYRRDPRLETILLDYSMSSSQAAIEALRGLEFRRFSPLVWKRPLPQLAASRDSLSRTMTLLRIADTRLRADRDPPTELRREIGTVAAEVMACALTFFDGTDRWQMLSDADAIFRTAMGPLMLGHEIGDADATLIARFWENRATPCGLEWSNIWDDPAIRPTVGMDVVNLAVEELDHATRWTKRHVARTPEADDSGRLGQFAADKAKWLAKAGRFGDARRHIDKAAAVGATAAGADGLLLKTLEQITSNSLEAALRTGSALADQLSEAADSIAPATSAILVHNIELMRGNRPKLGDKITEFLRESPVAASEHVNLPRYRQRLAHLGYTEAGA